MRESRSKTRQGQEPDKGKNDKAGQGERCFSIEMFLCEGVVL